MDFRTGGHIAPTTARRSPAESIPSLRKYFCDWARDIGCDEIRLRRAAQHKNRNERDTFARRSKRLEKRQKWRWIKRAFGKWCPGPESNQRHGDFQSPALPTELPGHLRRTAVERRSYKREAAGCPAPARLLKPLETRPIRGGIRRYGPKMERPGRSSRPGPSVGSLKRCWPSAAWLPERR